MITSNISECKYEDETVPRATEKWKDSEQMVRKLDFHVLDASLPILPGIEPAENLLPTHCFCPGKSGIEVDNQLPIILGSLAGDCSGRDPQKTFQVLKGEISLRTLETKKGGRTTKSSPENSALEFGQRRLQIRVSVQQHHGVGDLFHRSPGHEPLATIPTLSRNPLWYLPHLERAALQSFTTAKENLGLRHHLESKRKQWPSSKEFLTKTSQEKTVINNESFNAKTLTYIHKKQ